MLPNPSHFLRSDFTRVFTRKFETQKFFIVGECEDELDGNDPGARESGIALWFYARQGAEDETIARDLSESARKVVLLPARGADAVRRRPELVEKLKAFGFAPNYDCDLTELETSALLLVREEPDASVPAVEGAMARLHQRVGWLERTLRTRMSELEAADRHIARLEERVLSLKEAKKLVKVLKQEKQALRKSPERKIGQVLLAPYRLPQKLYREIQKRRRPAQDEPRMSAASASEYQIWFERHRATAGQVARMREEARGFAHAPLFSVITPVFNPPPDWLRAAVESVLAQAYENFELILVDDASTDAALVAALPEIAALDPRIRLLRREATGGISAASNDGLAVAQGEWIGLLDHDDLLEPDALFHTAKLLQNESQTDLVYTDEDKLTDGGFDSPLFKPEWSPDFFLSYNYLCHFITARHSLVREIGGFRSEFDGAQDYDLLLRLTEKTQRIRHVPRILYHWRRSATSTSDNIWRKPNALEAGRKAVEQHLERAGQIAAHVIVDWRTHAYWVKREIIEPRRISIIIPVRDSIPLLARCLDSLTSKTSYPDYEIVIVDNNSATAEAREYFAATPHRVLPYHGPFNYSAINNFAVEQTDAPWILFLNNDVEIIDDDWLNLLAEHVQRPEVGAVGGRLLYPEETVQHAGVIVGVGGIAQHAFRGFPAESPGVARQLQVIRNYSSVTGACLLTRREVFEEVGGFDEERLPVEFNDVDLCLKMARAGYRIIYTPFAKLYHHESATRRPPVEARETAVMRERWPDVLKDDPYYNPNLSRARADFSLGN